MNEDSIDQKQHLSFLSSVESNTKQFEIEKEELNSFNYQLKQKDYIILKGNAQAQSDTNEEKIKYSFCQVKAVNDSIVNFNNKKAQEKYHVNSLNKENSKKSLFDLNKTEWSDNEVKKCSNNQEEVISNFHCFLHNKTENEETDSILRTNSLSRLNEKEQLKIINGYHSLEENQTNSNKLQDLTLDSLPSNEVVLKDLSQEAQQNLNQGSFLNFTTPQNIKTGLHFSSRNITQFTKSTTITEPTNSYSPQRKIKLNLSPKLAITDFESRLNLATFEIKEDSAMKNVENDGIVLNEKKVLTKKAQDNMMQLLNNSSLNTMNNIQTSSKSNYVGIDNMMASDSRTDMLVYKESISQEIENKKDIENEQRRYDEGRKVIDTKEDNLKDMIHSEKQEDWDKVIRIDVATAFQKYEEFARKKVFLKGFQ